MDSDQYGPNLDRLVGLTGGRNKTAEAVEHMLAALPADAYEIGVGTHAGGGMKPRQFDAETVRRSIRWLARENARGRDIYFRPAGGRYVLLDDLTLDAVARMKAEGWEPALVTQTSPGNLQAWIDLGEQVEPDVRKKIARDLAQHYGADPNSAASEHLGRLPGYTNRKPRHITERGLQPFVLVIEAGQKVATMAARMIETVRAWIVGCKAEAEHKRRVAALVQPTRTQGAERVYLDAVNHYHAKDIKDGKPLDWSSIDFRAAQLMLVKGYAAEAVADVIVDRSPGIDVRHHNPVDYAERTAEAAATSPWVAEILAQKPAEARLRAQRAAAQRVQGGGDTSRADFFNV